MKQSAGANPGTGAEAARLILVTAPTGEPAISIARTLVQEQLVACVNIVPEVVSVYRWEGAVQQDSESLMIMKTAVDLIPQVQRRVLELHPYDTPEFVVAIPEHIEERYLKWLLDSVKSQRASISD